MSETLLDINDLSIAFGSAEPVVHNVSFSLKRAEMLALVGESGSGKSVTALSVLRLLPGSARYPSGQIHLQQQEMLTASEPELRGIRGNRVGMIFQEPMTSLNPLHTVEKQITETLKLHRGMGDKAARARALELLDLVGIPSPDERLKAYPHELSGGQRQRVMIAMALANEPELLIADEPTTALDVTIQKQILELLKELQQKLSMSILLITHDLNIVRRYADRVCVMKQGHLVEQNITAELFRAPTDPYTRMLLDSEPTGRAHPVATDAPQLLDARDVRVWFPIKKGLLQRTVDHFKAVEAISFSLRRGETLGIVGESGSGKTTLALAVLRLIKARGEIDFDDHSLLELNQKQLKPLRKEMQIVFQDPYGSLSPRMPINDIVAEGLEVQGVTSASEREKRVIEVLKEVNLDPEIRHRYPHEFSGGQRQRIAIARALILKPKLIVLDEPTSALDRTIQKQIIELLRSLQQRFQLSYLFISHDLAVVRALSHSILVMKQGQVVESGDAQSLFENPRQEYTRQLIDAAGLA